MLRKILALLAAGFLSIPTLAFETVEVSGRGETKNEAIVQALVQAVRQVNGARIESVPGASVFLEETVQGLTSRFVARVEDVQLLREVTRGYVRSYELLESKREESAVEVRLSATVLTFDPDNPRPGSAKSLVVAPFQLATGALRFDGKVEGAEALLETLRNDLETRLVRANKFLVLTRQDLGPLLKELQFIDGKWTSEEEKVKLGHQFGGDYLVSGRIESLAVHTDRRPPGPAGYVKVTKTADVALSLSMYNVGSGRIEWTESYARSYSWDGEELKRDPDLQDDQFVARALVLDASESLYATLLGRSFRPKVVKVKASPAGPVTFVLNAGSGILSVGDVLELVLLEPLGPDPDTGLDLGMDETFVGLLRITRQTDRTSEAVFAESTTALQDWARSLEEAERAKLACREHLGQ